MYSCGSPAANTAAAEEALGQERRKEAGEAKFSFQLEERGNKMYYLIIT